MASDLIGNLAGRWIVQQKRTLLEQISTLFWASPVNASLAFAVAFVLLWYGVLFLLDRRQIILKV